MEINELKQRVQQEVQRLVSNEVPIITPKQLVKLRDLHSLVILNTLQLHVVIEEFGLLRGEVYDADTLELELSPLHNYVTHSSDKRDEVISCIEDSEEVLEGTYSTNIHAIHQDFIDILEAIVKVKAILTEGVMTERVDVITKKVLYILAHNLYN